MRGGPKLVPAGPDSADQRPQLVYSAGRETPPPQQETTTPPLDDGGVAEAKFGAYSPPPQEKTPLLQNPSSLDSTGASPGSRFVMTHEVASPAVPRTVAYQTPTNRLSKIEAILKNKSHGTVARPDHDECLKRTALVVHKHVTVCEQREARRRRRARNPSLNATQTQTQTHATTDEASTTTTTTTRQQRGRPTPRSMSYDPLPSAFSGITPGRTLAVATATSESASRFRAAASRVFEEAAYLMPRYEIVFAKTPHSWLGFQFAVERARQVYEAPSTTDVYDFLITLFTRAHLSSECSIVCLIYVERLMDKGKVSLLRNNWRPILLCSMLLASKVWQDCASWNIEFSVIYPQFTLAAINLLERNFVAALGWDMYISQSLYAKYYYGLRALNEQNDFRRRYNMFVQRTTNERPKDALNVQQRSDKLTDVLANVYSRSL